MCRATISSQSAARTVEPPVQTALSETRITARFRVGCMAAQPSFAIALTSHPISARATRSKIRGLPVAPCPPTLARVVASTQDHPGRSAADLLRWNDAPPCLARCLCCNRPRARVRPTQRAHGHHCSGASTRHAAAASIRSRSGSPHRGAAAGSADGGARASARAHAGGDHAASAARMVRASCEQQDAAMPKCWVVTGAAMTQGDNRHRAG